MSEENQALHDQLSPESSSARWPRNIYIVIVMLSIYVLLVMIGLVFQWVYLKYFLTIIGSTFIYLIPELAGERKKQLLWLFLTCIPIIGMTFLQIVSDRSQDKARENVELGILRENEFKEKERRFYEEVIVNPGEVIRELQYADEGFTIEAQVVYLRIAERESSLLIANPSIIIDKVLELPDNPKQKLETYKTIRNIVQQQGKKGKDKSLLLIEEIESLLNRQVTYENLSDLSQELKKSYENVVFNANIGKLDEAKKGLKEIANRLLIRTDLYSAGGYFNNLSVVSLGYSSPEETLRWLYQGIHIEREHILIYETLAYALWALNQDSRTALRYAEKGLELNGALVNQVKLDYQNSIEKYNELLRTEPSFSSLLQKKLKILHKQYPPIEALATEYANELEARFKNLVCYFSAIELTNQETARNYAEELHRRYPKDLDYQETLGFVLMRFSSTVEELETALGHLKSVKEYAQTPLTRDLASAHYQVGIEKRKLLARQ